MERDNLRRRRPRRLGTAFGGILTAAFLAGAVGPVAGAAAAAPEITTQPTSQEVVEPLAATFVAGASGTPTPTVQWEVAEDGVVGGHFHNLEGATSPALKLEPTSFLENGYAYRAVFTNGEGTPAISSAATLTVDVPPKVTTVPTSVEVSEPANATFTAQATGSPNPTAQWYVSKDGGKTWAEVPGATSETLTIAHPTSVQNGNQYRVQFENKAGFATSPAATLTVRAGPQVTSSPTSQTVLAGEAASFTATATGTPAPSVQWEYKPKGAAQFSDLALATSSPLTIEHATVSENGRQYRARFTNGTGSPAWSAAATLTVNAAPVVTSQPVSATVTEPATATFKAEASGSPAPSVQWEVSTGGGPFNPVPGATSTTLKVEKTTLSQNGNAYRATFANGVGTAASSSATLTVNSPPFVQSSPESKTVLVGASATFSATGSGTPKPTVQWLLSKNGGGKWEPVPGATSEQLTIENAATTQSGYQYRAVFTSAGGEAGSAVATLTVYARPAPTITAPANGSSTGSALVRVEGSASTGPGDLPTITVKLYEGSAAEGAPTTITVKAAGGRWSTAFGALPKDGPYTLQAEQSDKGGFIGLSAPVSFTLNTALPKVTLTSPASGSTSTTASPTFEGEAGTAPGDSSTVTLSLYEGATAGVHLIRTSSATASAGHWATTLEPPLKNGTYTARAEQPNELGGVGQSESVTFTVAKPAPKVTLSSPANGSTSTTASLTFQGGAGTAKGDLPTVTLNLYEGATAAGQPVRSISTTASAGKWSIELKGLKNATYTARAEQSDELGVVGQSASVTFTVLKPAPVVTISSPANGSSTSSGTQPVEGTASTEAGTLPTVTIRLFEGATTAGPQRAAQAVTAESKSGHWATEFAKLKGGTTYTLRADQLDGLGNVGQSPPATFTVTTAAPKVTLTSPAINSSSSTGSQAFAGGAGTVPGDLPTVTLNLYEGATAGVHLIRTSTATAVAGHWATTLGSLKNGTYTARAEQEDGLGVNGQSESRTFTVAKPPPVVTVSSPAGGSATGSDTQPVEGTASGEGTVTILLYEGAATEGTPLEFHTVTPEIGGHWATAFGQLKDGSYTVRAEQADAIGNVGLSAPVTFTVAIPAPVVHPPPSPPVASFRWFPAAPHVGEQVSLASNSTSISSPIKASAWDVTGNGPFSAFGSVLTTSFSTAGPHAVRLRVTDGNGLSSIATRTIGVSALSMSLMQPFPIVRIAGSDYSSGVNLSLLSVLSPVGTLTTVSCRGRGCPIASQSRVSAAPRNRKKTVAVASRFRRFERPLRAGVVLEIRVTKPGLIGKYTRFAIRSGKLPTRLDACLGSKAPKPIACPSS